MHAIETQALSRTFGRRVAVSDLDLIVPAGRFFALLGSNGAGKTTTIKLLMNLLRPSGGYAKVLGCDSITLGIEQWQRIGYVSENQRLPDWMSPRQLLEYCRPFYPSWDSRFAAHLAERLALETDQPLHTLSRGTRMKVALLSALAYHPQLVVLDEPFSGLDPLVREELVSALLEASPVEPWTVLISSHDVEEVERLADTVGFMANGRLILQEPVERLLDRHRRIEVVTDVDPSPVTAVPDLLLEGRSGRTLRFLDRRHDHRERAARLASLFPGAQIDIKPVALREIFTMIARAARSKEAA